MPDDPSRRDPDARFVLANERTLLAWARTALAVMATGAGVAQFARDVPGRSTLAVLMLGIGILTALAGALRYHRADRALRDGRLPRTGGAGYALTAALVAVGLALVVAVLVR